MLKRQEELNFSPYVDLYEKLIPKDHIFRRINELVDFSFIEEEFWFLWMKKENKR